MSDDQQRHTHASAPGAGGWQPIPQGAGLDVEGTTFIQLPPELLEHPGPAAAGSWAPLAAPGTGYAPPAAAPPVAAQVAAPVEQWGGAYDTGAHGVVPGAGTGVDAGGEPGMADTAQWPMPFDVAAGDAGDPVPQGAGDTGQWTVPAAGDDSVEESGEYALRDPGPQYAPGAGAGVGTDAGAVDGVGGFTGPGDYPTGQWTAPGAVPDAAAQAETPEAHAAEPVEPVEPAEPVEPVASQPEPASEPAVDAVRAAAEEPAEALVQDEPLTPTDPAAGLPEASSDAEPYPTEPYPAEPLAYVQNEHPCASYVLRVNGTDRPVTDAWIGESLLYVLRERLGLAGAKDGCSQGECGACSVQVDGRLVASCLVPAATTAGSEVRTVEGLATHGQPSDVQRALAECGAVQCGFCVPGLAMTVHDLLEGNHAPTELETRQAICGNLCRCSGYRGVLDAVRQVVDERAEAAAALEEAQGQDGEQGPEGAHIPHQAAPYGNDGTSYGGDATPYGGDGTSYGHDGTPYGNDSAPYGDDGSGFGKASA